MSIKDKLICAFKGTTFTLKQAYELNPAVNEESVRARIYEGMGVYFKRIGRGLFVTKDLSCAVVEGNGRDLSILDDESIDCILTDHPWKDSATSGGNRNFASYECFQYTVQDFAEKARVLKDGCFLCEILPAENETNFDYLYSIKKMAEQCGFRYYAKVPWKKENFVSNTGRKAKDTEDVMIFSKGRARSLRFDVQRSLQYNTACYMSGAEMLPTEFVAPAVRNKRCQSEKPVALFEQILGFLTKENEVVLDQFAGSGAVGAACRNINRFCILFEKAKKCIEKIVRRLSLYNCTDTADKAELEII